MRWRKKICVVWVFTAFFLFVVMVSMHMHAGDFDEDPDVELSPFGIPKLTGLLLSNSQKKRLTRAAKYKTNVAKTGTKANTKYILLYNDVNGIKDWGLGLGMTLFKQLQCPVSNCAIMWGRSKLKYSAAVLFNVPELISNLPKRRPANQFWTLFSLEPPANVPRLAEYWRHQFNWTMSYSQSSTFQLDAVRYTKREVPQQHNWAKAASEQPKVVAWFVSDCKKSEIRMSYVHRLQKIIPVDIYGKCGRDHCPLKTNKESCEEMLGVPYKFYLTFEDSICKDYISDKTVAYLKNEVTIIVRLEEYHSAGEIPPHSYIDATDFDSPESLGRYILYLDKNPGEHAKYLDWRNKWDSKEPGLSQNVWCDFCQALHEDSPAKTKTDPYDEWFGESTCWDTTEL